MTKVLFIDYEHVIKRCENACHHHSQMVSNLLQMTALRSRQQTDRIYMLSRSSTRKKLIAYLHSLVNLRGVAKAEIKFSIEIKDEKKKALEGIATFLYYFN